MTEHKDDSGVFVVAREWTDEDGNPLGVWQPMTCQERERLWERHEAELTVFSGCTEVDVRVYTSWGLPGSQVPLFDDLLEGRRGDEDCRCEHRRFIARASS